MEILVRIIEAMVVTLREGVEAALVVGIVLAYLRKTGRARLSRYVYIGLVAAVIASVLGALAFQRYGLDPENETLEGTLMLVAAALVGSLVIWMWRSGRDLKGRIEGRLEGLSVSSMHGRAAFGLLAFTFFMVLREGIETVLFLSALSVTIAANPLYNFLGGTLGLALAFLFGLLLIQGTLRINLRRFFSTTSVVLLILVAKLFANGIHEFAEVGLVPTTETMLAIIGFLTRDATSVLILIALISLPALSMLWDSWKEEEIEGRPAESAAERRKKRAYLRRSRIWATAAAGVALGISLLLGITLVASATRGYDPPPKKLSPQVDTLLIPSQELEDGQIHKYALSIDEIEFRFFLLKREDGSVASAFDACGICPPKGYFQMGGNLVCRNCDAPIDPLTVGQPGGCNPIPLKVGRDGDFISIRLVELVQERTKFGGR